MSSSERPITGVCLDIPTIISDAKEEKRLLELVEEALRRMEPIANDNPENIRS